MSAMGPAPLNASDYFLLSDLVGRFVPYTGREPVFFRMPGPEVLYLPVFSKKHALRETLARAGASFTDAREIADPAKFVESMSMLANVVIILNPEFTRDGRVRFAVLRRFL